MKFSNKVKIAKIGNILDKPSNFNALLAVRSKLPVERPIAIQRPLTPRKYSESQ